MFIDGIKVDFGKFSWWEDEGAIDDERAGNGITSQLRSLIQSWRAAAYHHKIEWVGSPHTRPVDFCVWQ